MKLIRFILLAVGLGALAPLGAQKVGLVLSGGGAKGLTHIGIIRALEENNIPIDYVAGTSMGAIVGSLYAMGYSPDDMERLLKSEDFKRWYSAEVEEKYIYYFKQNPPTPEFINIRVSLKNPFNKVKAQFLPTSVVDPIQMNLAFLELFGRSTAASRGDFDQLFVPFRCVASDIYNKRPLIFSRGDLGDAVRASMSFPAMFKPIEIDSVLAYDGGIYNNFPVNVMREDFRPDVIIGSVVSSNPTKPQEGDIMSQLENMIMQKTDYSIPDSAGILMTFRYDDVNLMDFDRFDELHNKGYNRTMQLMDSIQTRVHRRVSYRDLERRRADYRRQLPEFRFRRITIEGANDQQKSYIRKEFYRSDGETFGIEEFRQGYFRLLADNMISEILPHAIYQPADQTYELHLKVKMEDELSLRVGGNVGSNGANQIYLGTTYHNLNNYAKELSVDGQLGQIYNHLQVAGRMDFPTRLPVSCQVVGALSSFDYYKQEKVFTSGDAPVFSKKKEQFVKLRFSLPFLNNDKAELGIGVGHLTDQYYQSTVIDFHNDRNDRSDYTVFGGSVAIGGNTLDSRQFATRGCRQRLSAHAYTGREKFAAGSTPDPYEGRYRHDQAWLQFCYERESYHSLSPKMTLGSYLKAYYSSRRNSRNYTATMMQAGEFSPTAHSRITYNDAFRANQFVGAGLLPIYHVNTAFQLRAGVYGFLPVYPLLRDEEGQAYKGKLLTHFSYMGEVALVFRLPFGAVSAYLNHYSSPSKNWNAGITLGWQIFHERFIE
ncbi:MAG: patatin-like phospholipase family protein [Bacteroidales bacterium]|nr:patatin-like phospholipase family protein [Bacteroidales bacterium]